MEYKKIGTKYVVRIMQGEEAVSSITAFCQKNNITSAQISAIGAASALQVAWYEVRTKTYHKRDFDGDFEITSLTGNIALLDTNPFLHAHVTFSDSEYRAWGGHLFPHA